MIHGMILLILVLAGGCRHTPPAIQDDRACYLGMVPANEVPAVQRWAPHAQAGDLLITAGCDDAQTDATLNAIRRNTR